jgi:hypothetical protein
MIIDVDGYSRPDTFSVGGCVIAVTLEYLGNDIAMRRLFSGHRDYKYLGASPIERSES